MSAAGPSIAQALAMIGAGCVGGAAIAWVAFKVSDAIETALDDAFAGDCWNVPPEGEWTGRQKLPEGGGGYRASASPSVTQMATNRTHGERGSTA